MASVDDIGIIDVDLQVVKVVTGLDVGKRSLDALASIGSPRCFDNTLKEMGVFGTTSAKW